MATRQFSRFAHPSKILPFAIKLAAEVLTCILRLGRSKSRARFARAMLGFCAEMPVGWETLGHWGEDVGRIAPLSGGVANDVWSVRVRGQL
jgi:hypothetical protein